MYETYRRQKDGSYVLSPALSSAGEKRLAENRLRKVKNDPDMDLPRRAGDTGIYWGGSAEWRSALSVVGAISIIGGCLILGYLSGGLAGACVSGYTAMQRVTRR